MKKSKLLIALVSAAFITYGCSSNENSTKEETKQAEVKKELLDLNNLKKENRKDPNFRYLTYSFLKLNNSNWNELTDEKINTFISEWVKKRDEYHDKSLLIYNADTKKGILAKGTADIINYKEYNINVPQSEHFNWDNPVESMYVWNDKEKTYEGLESKEKLDLKK